MDGVFMKKIFKFIICIILIYSVLGAFDLKKDLQVIKNELIRLHVVANSDSEEDQQIKLQVKDAVTNYLQPIMEKIPDKEQAMQYIRNHLADLQELSNRVLKQLGAEEQANVTLQEETFDTRDYDTFSLPAGVYDALRIEIGNADGKNWWCVVFPSLCLPASGSGFEDTAVSSGFSPKITKTLSNNNRYEVRFFLLDCIGKLENLFH